MLTQRRPRRMVVVVETGKCLFLHHSVTSNPSLTDVICRGVDGEEIQDAGFTMTNARRRSNSSSYAAGLKDFKTKFEHVEQEPVFEENLHGPEEDEDGLTQATRVNTESSEGSVDEEDKAKK
jgi:hypothetical protein